MNENARLLLSMAPLGMGRLTKISDNCNELRSNEVVGFFLRLPEVHSSFTIFADSLTPGADLRVVSTSLVTTVDWEGHEIVFRTLNSTYMLKIFDEKFWENFYGW